MTRLIGSNRNTNDEATVSSGVTLNPTTSTTIAPANPDRMAFFVDNGDSNNKSWVKLQPASVDDEKKGIYLTSSVLGTSSWTMGPDNIYTGEVSAIADGDSPQVFVTEY